jgi:hypothetical protein
MMKTTGEEDKQLIEAAFYSKPFFFSYSSLNRLLMAPNIFYTEYILKNKPIQTGKHLIAGTLVHFLLLEGNNFDDHFIITPETLPSENSMKVAHEVIKAYELRIKEEPDRIDLNLADFPDAILEALLEINLHQNLKDTKDGGKGDDKRVAKIVEPRTEAYFEYLKVKDKKDIIDSETLDKASLAVEKIKANTAIMDLLGMNRESDGKTFNAYNEIALQMDLPDLPFGLKGIIDNMTIDTKKKMICINDFKTSGKSLSDFPETVEYWKYWLQSVVYVKLATAYFKNVIKDDPTWSLEFRFVVFDKYDHLYGYKVKKETLADWTILYDEVIAAAKYHYESRDFTLPYKFAIGSVEL